MTRAECTPDPGEGRAPRDRMPGCGDPKVHGAAQRGKVSSTEGTTFPSSDPKGAPARGIPAGEARRTGHALCSRSRTGETAQVACFLWREGGSSTADSSDLLSPGSTSPSVVFA